MIKLRTLLNEINGEGPKAIFMAGPAGAGKSFILKELNIEGFKTINVDDDFEELLQKELGKTDFASMSPEELSTAGKLMGTARKTTREKEIAAVESLQNIVIDGTGAASNPLLKKKAELEALGYDTMMVMIWVSPYTSLERNASRDRALPPAIVLRTWAGTNKNIETYKSAFDTDFILIDNDPGADIDYDPEYAKDRFFKTVKGSGKTYSPEELVKKKEEIDATNQEIASLLTNIPDFMTIEDAKSKINTFLK